MEEEKDEEEETHICAIKHRTSQPAIAVTLSNLLAQNTAHSKRIVDTAIVGLYRAHLHCHEHEDQT